MHTLQQAKKIPHIPKGIINVTIVAGINALGRGQDREALVQFITTIAQTMGPEALAQYMNPDEAIKRLAAAQGIDYLNLIKSVEERDQEQQRNMQTQQQAALLQQAGQFANAPMMDPSKNPDAVDTMNQIVGQQQPDPNQADIPPVTQPQPE